MKSDFFGNSFVKQPVSLFSDDLPVVLRTSVDTLVGLLLITSHFGAADSR